MPRDLQKNSRWLRLQRQVLLAAPAVLTLVLGLTLTALAASWLLRQQDLELNQKLERQAGLFATTLEQRVSAHSDILHGMQAVFAIDTGEYRRHFLETLAQGMQMRRPGVLGLGFTHIVPSAEFLAYRQSALDYARSEGWVVEDNWPDLMGVDRRHYVVDYQWFTQGEPPRVTLNAWRTDATRDLLDRVERTGALQMSSPIMMERFGQEETEGIIVSAPVHSLASKSGNASHFMGTVNLSLSVDSLVGNLERRGMLPNILLSIRDLGAWPAIDQRGAAQAQEKLFESKGWQGAAVHSQGLPLYKEEIKLLGRLWQLSFLQQPEKMNVLQNVWVWMTGVVGTVVSFALAAVIALLSKHKKRAAIQTQARHNRLQHRADRFKVLFNQSAVGVMEFYPRSGKPKRVNSRFMEILGRSMEGVDSICFHDLVHVDDRDEYYSLIDKMLSGELVNSSQEYRLVRKDGSIMWVEQWTSHLENSLQPQIGSDDERNITFIAMLQDVTRRHEIQQQLREREAYSSDMLRYMPVGLVVLTPEGRVEFFNQKFEDMTRLHLGDIGDENGLWEFLCPGDDAPLVRIRQWRQNHRLKLAASKSEGNVSAAPEQLWFDEMVIETRTVPLPVQVSGSFMGDRIVLSFLDQTKSKQAEQEIKWLAYHDSVTHLPNRRSLLDKLNKSFGATQAGKRWGALLLMDLDKFKTLNETLGYSQGDVLLKHVGSRLSNDVCARQYALARHGSDEFAIVVDAINAENAQEAAWRVEKIATTIQDALAEPFYINGQEINITVCIGAAIFGEDTSLTVEDLMKRADLALHQAKSAGYGTLQFFDPRMQEALAARAEMEKDLSLAIERNELQLFYQPQVQNDRVVGTEALLRWKHPVKGFISPGVFVPLAEESDLILGVGEWVLHAACRQLAQWASVPHLAELSIAINVSARQFLLKDFVERVKTAIKKTGARPDLLELELTEGMLLTNVDETIQSIMELKKMGIRFALDDFGTGYSSLSYLRRLPLDKLKIDQSFVRDVLVNGNDASIACTVVALGHSLGLRVVAEGVETSEQRDFLAANGCTIWQGYYFSRPIPDAEFRPWVQGFDAAAHDAAKALQAQQAKNK